jgi:hypothetical protein
MWTQPDGAPPNVGREITDWGGGGETGELSSRVYKKMWTGCVATSVHRLKPIRFLPLGRYQIYGTAQQQQQQQQVQFTVHGVAGISNDLTSFNVVTVAGMQ